MPISRRVLLAVPMTLATAPAMAAAAPREVRLKPGERGVGFAIESGPIASRLRFVGYRESFVLPVPAAPLGLLPIAGRELLSVGFSANALAGVRQTLTALIGWDGRRLRILDVETLSFESGDGHQTGRLTARLTDTPDRRHLRLIASASRTQPHGPLLRESWVDLLAWHEGAPLASANPRPPPPDSWQGRMLASRRRIIGLLDTPRTQITLDMLAPTGVLDPLGRIGMRVTHS
jgi:hypothetical protein